MTALQAAAEAESLGSWGLPAVPHSTAQESKRLRTKFQDGEEGWADSPMHSSPLLVQHPLPGQTSRDPRNGETAPW